MNHKKATPAKGTRFNASAIVSVLASHAPDSSGSAGMERRSSPKIVNISREKMIPATAADFGVFRRALMKVSFSDIANRSSLHPCRRARAKPAKSALDVWRASNLNGNKQRTEREDHK